MHKAELALAELESDHRLVEAKQTHNFAERLQSYWLVDEAAVNSLEYLYQEIDGPLLGCKCSYLSSPSKH